MLKYDPIEDTPEFQAIKDELEKKIKVLYPSLAPLAKQCYLNTIETTVKECDNGDYFVITGDIPAFIKTAEDEKTEENTVDKFISTLPEEYRTELAALFDEMNRLETTEAKIYKALDKMETLIQHNEADISTWLPLEYEMNLVYGEKEVQFSEYMKELKKAVKAYQKEMGM